MRPGALAGNLLERTDRPTGAARLLLDGAPARVVEFPTELVVRCSTTRAPRVGQAARRGGLAEDSA